MASKPTNTPAPEEALLRARNHIDTARWELERAHPIMDPEEPCVFYEVWDELGRVRNLIVLAEELP